MSVKFFSIYFSLFIWLSTVTAFYAMEKYTVNVDSKSFPLALRMVREEEGDLVPAYDTYACSTCRNKAPYCPVVYGDVGCSKGKIDSMNLILPHIKYGFSWLCVSVDCISEALFWSLCCKKVANCIKTSSHEDEYYHKLHYYEQYEKFNNPEQMCALICGKKQKGFCPRLFANAKSSTTPNSMLGGVSTGFGWFSCNYCECETEAVCHRVDIGCIDCAKVEGERDIEEGISLGSGLKRSKGCGTSSLREDYLEGVSLGWKKWDNNKKRGENYKKKIEHKWNKKK